MGNRTISRSMARKLYTEFSRRWRREKNLAGLHGKPGYRKPTFSQWYAIHQRDTEMMRESTPTDVQEYLGVDPWVEQPAPRSAREIHGEVVPRDGRGVVTIPIAGDAEE